MSQCQELHLQLFGEPRKIADKIEYLIELIIKIDASCIFKPGKILINGQEVILIGQSESIEKIKQKINKDGFIYS